MINQILPIIINRLTVQVPELKYIDEDWGQLDYYADSPPLKFPSCIIELQQVQWNSQGMQVQNGVMQISITIADLKLGSNHQKAPASQKTTAASIFTILENIHKSLHGWNHQNLLFSMLQRLSTRKVKRDDGIRQFEIIYTCSCYDASATPIQTTITATTPIITTDMPS